MKIDPKSQKGAITLVVLVTMLFLIVFLMTMYIKISNKAQGSAETTKQIAEKYNNIGDLEIIYNSYFTNKDVIPIYTVEQLKKIGSGERLEIEQEGKIYTFTPQAYYILKNDLDLGGYYEEDSGVWAGTQWTPLPLSNSNGTQYEFIGVLDGLGHKITGMYINNKEGIKQGLFGTLNGIVKNLGITDGYINANKGIGAVAGVNNGSIENCYNSNTIQGASSYIGGIVGQNKGKITKCYNSGDITSTSSETDNIIGGIAGRTYTDIQNCYNLGFISAKGSFVGGIAGYADSNLENCYNRGRISSTNIKRANIGGITGAILGKAKYCYNYGMVQANGYYCGGIAGAGKLIECCYNQGDIKSEYNGGDNAAIGGITGTAEAGISFCYNSGAITSTGNYAGGITGNNWANIICCYNIGNINGNEFVGGISGNSFKEETNIYILNCYNIGIVSGTTKVGDIVGENSLLSTVKNCYYLNTSGLNTSGTDWGTTINCSSVTDEEMKGSNFVKLLNTELETIAWEEDTEGKVNEGYPILSWQLNY